jgi:hypothetical protein
MEGSGPAKDVSPLQAKTGQIDRCKIGDRLSELRLVDRSPRKRRQNFAGAVRRSLPRHHAARDVPDERERRSTIADAGRTSETDASDAPSIRVPEDGSITVGAVPACASFPSTAMR